MTLDDLQKIAQAATEGPWSIESGVTTRTAWAIAQWKEDHQNEEWVFCLDGSSNLELDLKTGRVEQNLEFVEAFNPEMVKKLLAVARAAKDACERLSCSDSGWVMNELEEALAALEAPT